MKRLIGIPLITLGLGFALLLGCGEKADQATQDMKKGVQETTEAAKKMSTEAKETVESAAAATKEKINAYLGDMKGQMENLDTEIEALSAKAGIVGETAKEKFKDQFAAVTEKKDAIAMKMDEMQGLSGDAWETAKKELDNMMTELTQSYENIKTQLSGT
jgi:chromosome segregation ATPase